MSEYGRSYLQAKIRQGTAHINRSEFTRALEITKAALGDPDEEQLSLVFSPFGLGAAGSGADFDFCREGAGA